MLNLYNFMDGIDGIASVEAVCACLGVALLYGLSGAFDLLWGPLVLAFSVVGFLYWNFPPARIFMETPGGIPSVTWGPFVAGWLELVGLFLGLVDFARCFYCRRYCHARAQVHPRRKGVWGSPSQPVDISLHLVGTASTCRLQRQPG